MKHIPENDSIRQDLHGAHLSREGFMGDDARSFETIIADDALALSSIAVTPRKIADKMEEMTTAGMEGQGGRIPTGEYLVEVEEFTGQLHCPLRDARGPYRNPFAGDNNGRTYTWSDLSIHLIRAHGFFQGEGSTYRLSPVALARFLGLAE